MSKLLNVFISGNAIVRKKEAPEKEHKMWCTKN